MISTNILFIGTSILETHIAIAVKFDSSFLISAKLLRCLSMGMVNPIFTIYSKIFIIRPPHQSLTFNYVEKEGMGSQSAFDWIADIELDEFTDGP